MIDEAIAVTGTQRDQLLDRESVGVCEQPGERADGDDPGSSTLERSRGARAHLPKALDRNARADQRALEVRERRLRGRFDAVTGRKIVHPQPLMHPRP